MSDSPPRPGSVLILDDEEIVLIALGETLRREGHEVAAFSSPMAALESLREKQFSVILTDQQMPELTGLEFLARAKQVQPDAARILITGVRSLGTVIDAINQGEIHRFIAKPWLREELIVTVQNAVQRYELLRHNRELQAQTQAANEALGAQVSRIAEQNQQLEVLNSALRRNLDQSVQLCVKTLESYWPVLSNQARRVQELCRAAAHTLGLPPAQRQVLDIAALLHDIGLIEVPRAVIRKWRERPEMLGDAELAQIQRHPVLGQELVSFVENLEDVGGIVRAHHERYDGAGYPDRVAGEGIPWLARLLSVAVAYANFPSANGAVEFIKAHSGLAFDPEAVRVFLRALPHANLPRRQREVLLLELRPGMVLAQGIYASSGLLLVPEGQSLSEPCIEKLRCHDEVNAIGTPPVIYG